MPVAPVSVVVPVQPVVTNGLATQLASKPPAVSVLSVTNSTKIWLVVEDTSAGRLVPVSEMRSGAVGSAPS